MPALRRAVETAAGKVKPGYNPEIAFLLAVKKVPQRIFELNTGQRGRGDKGQNKILNPTSGSVIGAPLSRYSFDFFLVPQYVNQGTATPTHYIVVHNTTKLSEEALQTITYEQCYNYFNWQGAVRIPGALMYANKLATIVGEHLKKAPTDDNLKDKLYSL
jgi:aubergine-like protein